MCHQKSIYKTPTSPIIAFGGSYGGQSHLYVVCGVRGCVMCRYAGRMVQDEVSSNSPGVC